MLIVLLYQVLGKFPVVQHIVFGSLFPLKTASLNANVPKARMSLTSPPAKVTNPEINTCDSLDMKSVESRPSVTEPEGSSDHEASINDDAAKQNDSENSIQ